MRALVAALLTSAALLAGCQSGPGRVPNLPKPMNFTTLGQGDMLEIRIVGARVEGGTDLPSEFKVAPDGTVNVPFIGPTVVVGLEPNEIEQLVRERLITKNFYTDPQVSVVVRGYFSKRVSIIGQVKKPDSYPLESGMGLQKLISLAGGFTDIADDDNIIIQRKTLEGKTVVDSVDYDDIRDGRISDVLLQAGDYVEVKKSPI
ncbi:MAG: polysaccharide biosynthesis/export family protein [Polyangiaceae bacterium]|jgi:protein involved in polysaccharide export with SLBB domain|nr:polysaccharide biosynthesis/export family protein [Polyangiaceae bacterium]MBK8938931.1 polysaccharide biosynthesis/export family protein [Polyangiaceae bacterium]